MTRAETDRSVSRRTALAGLGAGGLGLALGASGAAAAQEMSTADHPLTGMWLALANPARVEDPQVPGSGLCAADGTVILNWVPAAIGLDGALQYQSIYMGVWEPYDERTGHFTAVQVTADAGGNLTGTVTVDGHPEVSEDGTTFVDTGVLVTVTIRDAAGKVVAVIPPAPTPRPVTGIKMRVGNPGFPGEENATPTP
jgi:hypothetical protein